jgi:undecaprenyl-diphosphatase
VVGLLMEKKIEALFHQPGVPIASSAMVVMGLIIIVLGVVLFLADKLAKHDKALNQMTLKDVLIIGCAQALAIFPGVSRSGSTISAGLALGLKRDTAARFSFYLSAPIIAGAGLKSIYDIYEGIKTGGIASNDWVLFPIGLITAAVSGYFCIRFLLKYLQTHSVNPFVYYRWGLAVLIIIVALAR